MIIIASAVTSLMPIMYSYACSITTDAINNINYFLPSSSNMSDIIIQSGRVNIEDTNADYLYLPSFTFLFLVIVLPFMAVFIYAITTLLPEQRFYLLILKYLISPYAISRLVDPKLIIEWIDNNQTTIYPYCIINIIFNNLHFLDSIAP